MVLGAGAAVTQAVSYSLLMESIEQKHTFAAGAILQSVDAAGALYGTIYFKFIDKDWVYFGIFIAALNFIILLMFLLIV